MQTRQAFLFFFFFFLLEPLVAFLSELCHKVAGTNRSPWNEYQNWGLPLFNKAAHVRRKGRLQKGQLKSYWITPVEAGLYAPGACSLLWLRPSSSLADLRGFAVRTRQDCGISNGFLFRAITVTKFLNLDVSWSLEIKIEAFDHSCLVGTGGAFDWGPDLISHIEWPFSDIQGGS